MWPFHISHAFIIVTLTRVIWLLLPWQHRSPDSRLLRQKTPGRVRILGQSAEKWAFVSEGDMLSDKWVSSLLTDLLGFRNNAVNWDYCTTVAYYKGNKELHLHPRFVHLCCGNGQSVLGSTWHVDPVAIGGHSSRFYTSYWHNGTKFKTTRFQEAAHSHCKLWFMSAVVERHTQRMRVSQRQRIRSNQSFSHCFIVVKFLLDVMYMSSILHIKCV